MARVLIVEDDPAQRSLVEIMLRRAGHESGSAESAEHALEILHQDSSFDVILTDIRMPRMSGVTFLKELRGLYPAIPVIVMTAQGNTNWEAEARENGAAVCLVKPFISGQLTAALHGINNPSTEELAG
jgi:DNA-binding NtrC family response regulator